VCNDEEPELEKEAFESRRQKNIAREKRAAKRKGPKHGEKRRQFSLSPDASY
jgi:hypothetical protein